VKSATPFNESFAQLVGYRSAEAFFQERGDSVHARQAADRWHDEIVLGDYYSALVARLESLYAQDPDSAALEDGRRAAAAWARAQLQGPIGQRFRTFRIGRLSERPINNAQLIGARIYRTRLDLFERWYEQHGRDIRTSVRGLKTLMTGVEGDSAYARLERAVEDSSKVRADVSGKK
jgi:predicted aminopeptidase